MELIILLILFLPIIAMALRFKEWYLYIFCAFFSIFPDSFAIEITSELPLLTANRIMILLLLALILKRKNGILRFRLAKEFWIYILVCVILSSIHFIGNFGELNRLFNLFIAQFLVVIIVGTLADSSVVFYRCISFAVYGFLVSAIIGILQTVADIDAATPLQLVIRGEFGLNDRMGMTRAYGTLNSAILFGSVCAFAFLLCMYIYELSSKRKYIIIGLVIFGTLLCTMSRSSLSVLAVVLLLMCIFRFRSVVIKYGKYILVVLLLAVGIACLVPEFVTKILQPVYSILNILGADYNIASSFGDNIDSPVLSRTMQWSLLEYMSKNIKTLLLGYGYNSYGRGLLHFYYAGYSAWDRAQALDVGFVAILGDYGLLGLVNNIFFVIAIFRKAFKQNRLKRAILKDDIKTFNFYQLTMYIIIFYILINIASAFVDQNAFILFISLFYAYENIGINQSKKKEIN